jgi:hypothetical protein
MGNTPPKDSVIPKWERNMTKGNNCHYYIISSDPELFQKRKCVIIEHDDNDIHYTLKDIELDLLYEDVHSVFVSSSMIDYSWENYFKQDTVVKTNATSLDKHGKFTHRARIASINRDHERGTSVDLVDVRTGFRAYCITPSNFALDKVFYNIK